MLNFDIDIAPPAPALLTWITALAAVAVLACLTLFPGCALVAAVPGV